MTSSKTSNVASKISNFLQDEEAASAAEYGILAALVAVAIITAVTAFGGKLTSTFQNMTNRIPVGN